MIANLFITLEELTLDASVGDASEVIVEAPLGLGRQIAQLPQHIKKYIKITILYFYIIPISN
jgi:hypothetical protein